MHHQSMHRSWGAKRKKSWVAARATHVDGRRIRIDRISYLHGSTYTYTSRAIGYRLRLRLYSYHIDVDVQYVNMYVEYSNHCDNPLSIV